MEIQMKLQEILDNAHVKRAIEIAKIGDHSIIFTGYRSVAIQFETWCYENGIESAVGDGREDYYDITIDVQKPRPEITVKWDTQSNGIFDRVALTDGFWPSDDFDNSTQRLLESATKTLELSPNDVKQVISVMVSIARSYQEEVQAYHLAEALQYWGK